MAASTTLAKEKFQMYRDTGHLNAGKGTLRLLCGAPAGAVVRAAAVVVVSMAVFAAHGAAAEAKIYEVQPWPIDGPTQLVIWGHGFDDPEILFGTHAVALTIADPDDLCAGTVGSPTPPLDLDDPANFDCVVAQLPLVHGGEGPSYSRHLSPRRREEP